MAHQKVIHLRDLLDPRVEVYRDLKGRDVAGRGELFILEGENSIQNLVNYGKIPLVSLCVSEKRLEAMGALLTTVLGLGVPVYALPQAILDDVVGYNFHRGVLGCGRKIPTTPLADFLPREGPILLCERVNNLDNVGALFRNAAAFGAKAILFDAQSSDPYYRKSLRVSGGHALAIPFRRGGTLADIIQAAKDNDFHVLALVTPHTKGKEEKRPLSIADWQPVRAGQQVALLVGAEGPGLSPEAIALADRAVTIPMADDVDSLNVATSAAVALFQVTQRRRTSFSDSRRRRRRLLLMAGLCCGGLLVALRRRPHRILGGGGN